MGTRSMIAGALLGAGVMYFLDPRQGGRRRALVADQVNHLARRTSHGLDVAWRDLQNRTAGTAAELQGLMECHDAPDDVIAQRVRTRLGRLVSHAAAIIEVNVSDGRVALRGPVLRHEAEPLLAAIRWVRGVRSVQDQLDVRDQPDDEPALQGEGRCAQGWRGNWAPATRLLASGMGGAMLLNCLLRRSPGALVGGLAGTALLVRALSNRKLSEALGIASERRPIDVRKTITIDAPLEQVFNFFAEPKNLERISDMITKVEPRPGGGFTKHMLIAGLPVRMDERFTRQEPHQLIEAESEGASPFEYAKQLRFQQSGGGTRVDILFRYKPPGGVLAHAAAEALGFDPKTLLDDLMMRAKSTLERGRLPHDATKTQQDGRPQPPASQHRPASPVEAARTEMLGPLGAGAVWPQPSGQVPPAV